MTSEMKMVLEPQEEVLWEGGRNKKVVRTQLIIGLVLALGVFVFCFAQNTITVTENGLPVTYSGILVGGIAAFIIAILSILMFFSGNVEEYAITNKRVLIKSGFPGINFDSLYYPQIRSAKVNVNLFHKMFSVGTINIDTGKVDWHIDTRINDTMASQVHKKTVYDSLSSIDNPYDVYKTLQKALNLSITEIRQ